MLQSMKPFLLALLLAATSLQASDLWSTDYKSALARAASENKPVLLEFTGSDWCPPCKMMTAQIFETHEFTEFAKASLVPVKLDYPRTKPQSTELKTQNQELAQQYGIEGFPTIVLLSSEGNELGRNVGLMRGGPAAMISWIESKLK
jgi:protein disulfide-isomerase